MAALETARPHKSHFTYWSHCLHHPWQDRIDALSKAHPGRLKVMCCVLYLRQDLCIEYLFMSTVVCICHA